MDDELGKAGMEGEQMNGWRGIPETSVPHPPHVVCTEIGPLETKPKAQPFVNNNVKVFIRFLSRVP